jgi:hypothetical protein
MVQVPAKIQRRTGFGWKTPWGEPDLQGIWTDETDMPLQRSNGFIHSGTAERRWGAGLL